MSLYIVPDGYVNRPCHCYSYVISEWLCEQTMPLLLLALIQNGNVIRPCHYFVFHCHCLIDGLCCTCPVLCGLAALNTEADTEVAILMI